MGLINKFVLGCADALRVPKGILKDVLTCGSMFVIGEESFTAKELREMREEEMAEDLREIVRELKRQGKLWRIRP